MQDASKVLLTAFHGTLYPFISTHNLKMSLHQGDGISLDAASTIMFPSHANLGDMFANTSILGARVLRKPGALLRLRFPSGDPCLFSKMETPSKPGVRTVRGRPSQKRRVYLTNKHMRG